VPELERLARAITRWEVPILRWHRTRLTNAATEGTNLIIKNIKRLGFGFRNFDNYRLRLLLRCGAPWRGCCIEVAPLSAGGAGVVGRLV
jgi:transposase